MTTRHARIAALLAAGVLGLTACGGGDNEPKTAETTTSAPTASSSPSQSAQVIEITFSGKTVTPQGKLIEVDLKKPVELQVTADAPGEIHIHSTPEQTISYAKGKSTTELTFTKPGVIEVESHTLDKLIAQLEVK